MKWIIRLDFFVVSANYPLIWYLLRLSNLFDPKIFSMPDQNYILSINAGSSSIRIALYKTGSEPQIKLAAKIQNIGLNNASFIINQNDVQNEEPINGSNFHTSILALLKWIEKQEWFPKLIAIGHRVVHGMKHTAPELVTTILLKELNSIRDYDPDHLPAEIAIIALFFEKYPKLIQIVCFDTAFHTTIPLVAKTFAIPKKYFEKGVQRYGFHGISYSYLMQELHKQSKAQIHSKIIIAHLGSGASIAAVKDGKCIDTSMGFTPAGGIVMSTRSGDLDPGVAWYLMQEGKDAQEFNEMINHQSGLLGVSDLSADMKVLLKHEDENKDAALAIDIFCYQIKKYIGAYTAALGGLDALVFSGGIGEKAAIIRSRICADLDYFGIRLNEEMNSKNELLISEQGSKVNVYTIPTNEELMIAKMVSDTLKNI